MGGGDYVYTYVHTYIKLIQSSTLFSYFHPILSFLHSYTPILHTLIPILPILHTPILSFLHTSIPPFLHSQMKSMAQYLGRKNLLNASRKNRFSVKFMKDLESLVNLIASDIAEKHIRDVLYARRLNFSLAFFIHDALSLMDRGFVFSLIKCYLKKVRARDGFLLVGCGVVWYNVVLYVR